MHKQFLKEFFFLLGITALFYAAAFAESVSTVPLVKSPQPDISRPVILMPDNTVYGCPDGSDLYVRQLEPKKKDPKAAAPQGDFKSFHYIAAQVGVLRSTPEQPFLPVCFQVK